MRMRNLLLVGGVAVVAAGAVAVLQSGYRPEWLAGNDSASATPAPAPTLRLLSQSQYANTIHQVFGPDITVKVRFPSVQRTEGLLAVGSSTAVITPGAVDAFDTSARAISQQVVDPAHRGLLLPCQPVDPKAADEKCARAFFTEVGRLLYRRPLKSDELTQAVSTATSAVGQAGDFYAGLAYALTGMLVSPQFLYIWENPERSHGGYRLDAYSKATRLSFLLWNSAPDKQLLTAAEHGDLNDNAGVKRQVDRMLASPLFKQGVRAFFTDMYQLELFDNIDKDPTAYPAFSPKVVDEAREQILKTVVDELVNRDSDYRDLYTTKRTFISADTSVLYRVPVDLGAVGWTPYQFQDNDPRAGLLTQIGFLAQYSHPVRSSATLRGKAIREILLCQKVPEPPPNVDFSAFENPKNPFPTARLRLDAHHENPVCAGCHRLIDPVGLALENFDAAGQYRTTENGAPIDASGELDGVKYSDAVGFAKAVHDNPALKACIVDRVYAYSVGRKVSPDEKPLMTQYEATLDKKGYRFDEMLRLVILDKSFFAVSAPDVADAASVKTASN